jgi:hemerythrin superfamily protein
MFGLLIGMPVRLDGNINAQLFFGDARMNALEILTTDHKNVKRLFKNAEGTTHKQQLKIFERIKDELETHTHIEETVFYPAIAKIAELEDMVLESLEEHKQVKTLLRDMEKLTADSEKFEPKLKVLMENVEHHAVEEEEEKMFPKIRKHMDDRTLEQLGAKLEAAKRHNERKAS